jgi:phosphohistidine phosphatase
MLTVMLLRHAKSSWDAPALADFDRPLAKRGIKAAPAMGRAIAELGLKPDLILCSPANRTLQTLALALPEMGNIAAKIINDDAIYMAAPETLLAMLRKLPDGPDAPHTVMIVGHNPGMEELADDLTGGGEMEALEEMAEKFPTAALAVINFDVGRWRDVEPGTGSLALFLTPARLT